MYILMKLSGYYFKVDCYRMLTVIPESPIRKYLKYTEKEMRWESKWYTTKNQLRGKKKKKNPPDLGFELFTNLIMNMSATRVLGIHFI